MKALKPIELTERADKRLQKVVFDEIAKSVYSGIFQLLKQYSQPRLAIENANGALREGLRSGRIQYIDGYIKGRVNSKMVRELRKLGGTFDKRKKLWKIHQDAFPFDLVIAAVEAKARIDQLYKEVENTLDKNLNLITERLNQANFEKEYLQSIGELDKGFQRTVQAAAVAPDFTAEAKATIAKQYSDNMKLYIKGFSEKQIKKLRSRVEKSFAEGYRAETLIEGIQKEYNTSFKKAKFLARQENTLLNGTYTKQRYESTGITKYRWSSSVDERVRDEHKKLHGKIFSWGEAVIDEKGTRGNPKEAFGCRCQAIPLLDL